MATVNDALRDLYLACGGDPANLSDNHAVEDYIKDLKTVLTGGGGGGSDFFLVTFTKEWNAETQSEETICDKTNAEIKQAVLGGKVVLGRYVLDNTSYYAFYKKQTFDYTRELVFKFRTNQSIEIEGDAFYFTISEDWITIGEDNELSFNGYNATFEGRGNIF